MTTPSPLEKAAKPLGFVLLLAGVVLIFFTEHLWKWGGVCTGFGYFFSYFGYRKEAERLRKDIEELSVQKTARVKEPV
jgi:hypothetical protein